MKPDVERRAIWIKLATTQIAALDRLCNPGDMPRTQVLRLCLDKGIIALKAERQREAKRDAARARAGGL